MLSYIYRLMYSYYIHMAKIEISNLLSEVDAETVTDRHQISLYISKQVYTEFQKKCGDRSASRIVEKLMRWFFESKV